MFGPLEILVVLVGLAVLAALLTLAVVVTVNLLNRRKKTGPETQE